MRARWEILGAIGGDLVTSLKRAKSAAQRTTLANQAAADALSTLATLPGIEAEAARRLIAALSAAHTGGRE